MPFSGNRSILTSRQTYWKSCHKSRSRGWSMVWISGSVAYRTQSPERARKREYSKWTEIRAKSHIACCFLFCPSCFPPFMRFNPPFHPYSIPISSPLLEARLRIISEIRAGIGVCVCVCAPLWVTKWSIDPCCACLSTDCQYVPLGINRQYIYVFESMNACF